MLDHIAFASPWLAGFFVALPLLWWLLRLTPPAPRTVIFPALNLLRGLAVREETPARTPWWLLLLRLIIAALLILAFMRPLINPVPAIHGKGVLLIAVDNDWAAARDWDARQKILSDLVRQAGHEDRAVILLPTAPSAAGDVPAADGPMAAAAAEIKLRNLIPQPWAADWQRAGGALQKLDGSTIADSVWLASGLGNADAKIFYEDLQKNGNVRVLGTAAPIYDLMPPQSKDEGLSLAVMRATTDEAATLDIDAVARDGNVLARLPVKFSMGAPRAFVPLDLPLDLRNQVARFEVENSRTAATTALLDSGWEHRPVGLVGDKADLEQHSLLNPLYYIDRALKPYADLHVDRLADLLKQNMAVLILTDAVELNDDDIQALTAWVKHGGVLVRFAGERLSMAPNPKEQDLLPVTLRTGDRAMGGTLSWAVPQKLRDFPAASPFHGLVVPADVAVNRQVLAEPSADLAQKTWADLTDGTPLVTARAIGQGLTILFHVPASSDWSNLPLSGLFVDMLRRITELSRWTAANGADFSSLAPLRVLNAFGVEQAPGSAVQPIAGDDLSRVTAGPQHPPGLYGTDSFNRAFNLGPAIGQPEALQGVSIETAQKIPGETDLQPWLLAAAFMLLLGDFFISLRLRGILPLPRRKAAAALCFLALVFSLHPARAANDDKNPVELTSKTYLAYVRTGDRDTDHITEAGLNGLAQVLQNRTSIDHVGVTGVDPATDELAFFPLLYWPLVAGEAPLPPAGAAHVNDYLNHGGMILFDAMEGEDPSPALLQHLLAGVDIPPLAKLPDNHVLKHTFYLLDEFPGRFANTAFWLEPEDMSTHDGVATVLYGSNGWAAAWALDAAGKPLFPCSPGGEEQRERAYRFGVNLVMYALTGNYKSDQLHAQALLQKLGR